MIIFQMLQLLMKVQQFIFCLPDNLTKRIVYFHVRKQKTGADQNGTHAPSLTTGSSLSQSNRKGISN